MESILRETSAALIISDGTEDERLGEHHQFELLVQHLMNCAPELLRLRVGWPGQFPPGDAGRESG
jgi:hypothetical protein